MKKLIQPLTALLYSLVAVLLGIGVYVMIAFSWFTNTELVEPDLSGFSVSAYFGGGNGSPDDPFLIKNNRHLYNLCWLQYLGYFNKQGALDEHGRIVTQGHENEMTQFSFSIETNLNMTGWYLPPLGTTLNPFVGLLNGQGHTISGLQTTNTFSEFGNKHPSSVNASNFANVEVIGFAGVIGKYDSMRLNSLSIDPDANAIANIKLSGTQVRTKDSTLAGIAAGYINATVEDVGIVGGEIYFTANSSVFGSMEDISAYTVAGYATEGYVTRTSTTKATVLNPTNTVKTSYVYSDEGDTTGWGGSIDMKSLWTRISYYSSYNNHSYGLNFITSETRTITSSGTTVKDQVVGTRKYTNTYTAGTYAKKTLADSSDYSSGIYLLDKKNVPSSTEWNYLTGLYKTVRLIYVHDETTDGYKITDDNGNFLNLIDGDSYGNSRLGNGTNEDEATVWVYNNGKLYTYSIYDGYIYWLNGTTDLSVTHTEPGEEITTPRNDNATNWTFDETAGSYYSTYNNLKYYIYFDDTDGWILQTPDYYYYITDGNGNYLSINGTNLVNVTNVNDATEWYFSSPGENASGYILVYANNNWYYLGRNNGNLVLTTNYYDNTWNNTGNGLYYGNGSITFENGNWSYSEPTQYYIKNGDNYLTVSGTNVANTTNVNNATTWTFSNPGNNPSGTISTVINNQTYYLVAGDGNLTLSRTNAINYTNYNNRNILYYYSTRYYQIRYNNGWTGRRSSNIQTGNSYIMTLQSKIDGAKPIYSDDYMENIGTRIEDEINLITLDFKEEVSEHGYIPLNTNNMATDGNYNVTIKNTGYIIGGGYESTSSYKGDIRVSEYAIGNISNGYTQGATYLTQVLTVNNNGIIDITNSTSYNKLVDSKEKFVSKALQGSSYVYGLHFMNTYISKDKYIVAQKVMINGQSYDNYQMPEDSIDFRLAEKGYINFFAGDFFSGNGGNKSFCALHQIFRDENNNITDIKHINVIYVKKDSSGNEVKNADYIYLYTDGTYSAPLESGYTVAFSSQWIENPGIGVSSNLYYFEIPANAGEYALGAVEGKVGGYIFYLDIGANAQEIHRTEIAQKSVLSRYDYAYPNGIAIITENTVINPNQISLNASNSASFKVSSASQAQSIIATRTSDTAINFATGITNGAVVYKPRTVTVTKNNSAVQATAIRTTTSIYSQIQYIDHNTTSGDIFETTIQKIDSNAPTYSIYKIGEDHTTTGFTPILIDTTAQRPAWKLYAIVDNKNVLVNLTSASDTNATAIKNQLTNIANTTVTTANTCLDYEYDTVTGATNTYAIHINMEINSNDLYYYVFTGDDVTVTTDNVGGTIIYVNVSNTTYTFRLLNNDHTANLVVGTNVTLPLQ